MTERPDLEHKVSFLGHPSSYPTGTDWVEPVETHMAWVFLTDRHAFKLKKPVEYDFLDFRTLESRRRDCEREVRLNRRLAPDVYLGTLPLTLEADGTLALEGDGETVEWLVKMRRLPRERFLEEAIRRGTAEPAALRRAAEMLARFYRDAAPVPTSPAEYRRRFREEIRENRRELARPAFGLPGELVQAVAVAQLEFVDREREALGRRAREGRIVEGHGDLRPEHVWLGPEPVIIDCIEFRREFRVLDPVEELAFLALECERLEAPWVGQLFLDAYRELTGDDPPDRLMSFYESHRACIRARLAVWHTREEVEDPEKWVRTAADYLVRAERHIQEAAALRTRA